MDLTDILKRHSRQVEDALRHLDRRAPARVPDPEQIYQDTVQRVAQALQRRRVTEEQIYEDTVQRVARAIQRHRQ